MQALVQLLRLVYRCKALNEAVEADRIWWHLFYVYTAAVGNIVYCYYLYEITQQFPVFPAPLLT